MLESLFDPRDSAAFAVILEMDDPDYCESKAMELIREAKLTRKASITNTQADEKIAQAISLLALARVQRDTLQS